MEPWSCMCTAIPSNVYELSETDEHSIRALIEIHKASTVLRYASDFIQRHMACSIRCRMYRGSFPNELMLLVENICAYTALNRACIAPYYIYNASEHTLRAKDRIRSCCIFVCVVNCFLLGKKHCRQILLLATFSNSVLAYGVCGVSCSGYGVFLWQFPHRLL